jgi:tripartite-type tricarboxylate transporter receptor subunit TctC
VQLFARRQFLVLTAGTLTLPVTSHIVRGQTYPTRPVRIVVGVAAGGSADILARLTAQRLSERLGQQVVVENRPGGGTNIATESVVRSPADGHTLYFAGNTGTVNATLYEKLNFDFRRDLAPVARLVRVPLVMVVNPSFPATTVPDFIAYSKGNPGKVNMASAGIGTPNHMAGELFKMMAGVEMTHVPYRGAGPALTDLLGGQVQVLFDILPSSIEHIKNGRLRALAMTTGTRSQALPNVPAMNEYVPGYETSAWFGVVAPNATASLIVERLHGEFNEILSDATTKARLADLGAEPFLATTIEFRNFIGGEIDKWAKVIRAGNIKPE